MFVSMILVFREAMEAGLIIGIILAASEGVAGRRQWIAGGIAAGVAAAGLIAVFAGALSDAFQGAGQEAFTATILIFAVAMLSWHIVWMSQHARTMAAEFRQVGRAVQLGQRSLAALASVVAVAVMREGAEVVLFLYGIVVASHASAMSLVIGGMAGLALAAIMSWLLYRGLLAIPLHRLFRVTNGLIALLAAGMAGQAAAVLHGADMLPGWGEHLWDTSAVLTDDSLVGRGMHALMGYSARPSGIQFAAWLATLMMLAILSRLVGRRPPRAKVLALALVTTLLVGGPVARADDALALEIRQHTFVPDRIVVPARVKFRLLVKNNDDTAEEFESTDLNREKLVRPGQTITVFLGPLEPGEYRFFGDFHQATAKGVMVAR
jgi:high-affinity iron transporter